MAGIDDEFVVSRSRLPRATPFPTWDGVLACSADGLLISLLCESGCVYVLAPSHASDPSSHSLHLHQILDPDTPQGTNMSMCQIWTRSGQTLVVARDRDLTVYRLNSDGRLSASLKISLRFAATGIDVIEDTDSRDLFLAVGSVAGITTYSIREDVFQLLVSMMEDVSTSVIRFSPDESVLAVGTIDGRILVLRRSGTSLSDMKSDSSFVKVLAAPRVTSVTFSPRSDQIIVSTRKGNVYVLTKSGSCPSQWRVDDRFDALVTNPKGGATCQTLSCWWGASPVFVVTGRVSSTTLELYDLRSRTLLHSLQLASRDALQGPNDLHLMGVVCLPATDPSQSSPLLCIDSHANLTVVSWPFLEVACPPL